MLIKKANPADRRFQQAFRHDLTTLPTQFIRLGAVGLPSLTDCAELSPSGAVRFAYYGHNQMPEDREAFKQAVADDGFFTILLKNRQRVLTKRIEAQKRTLARSGLSVTITDDDHDDPMLELLPAGYKKAVSAHVDDDRAIKNIGKFLNFSRQQRLEYFANDMGFGSFEEVQKFYEALDRHCRDAGFSNYANLCRSSRFVKYRLQKDGPLGDLFVNEDAQEQIRVFERFSPFFVDLLLACRRAKNKSFWVQAYQGAVLYLVRTESGVYYDLLGNKYEEGDGQPKRKPDQIEAPELMVHEIRRIAQARLGDDRLI